MALHNARGTYDRLDSYSNDVELPEYSDRIGTGTLETDAAITKNLATDACDVVRSDTDLASLESDRRRDGKFSGWRISAIAAAGTAVLVLLVNIALTIWITKRSKPLAEEDGLQTIFEGSCNATKETSRWTHFVINALSTILLGCSNFSMQVLSSPTRDELVRAHNKKKWLHLGVPNTRNLAHIGKRRAILWILLFLSSVPLHLLFNSVIFSRVQANDYKVLPVTPGFLNGGVYNTSGFLDVTTDKLKTVLNETSLLREKFDNLNASSVRNMTTRDCLSAYSGQYISNLGDVLLVQENVIWRDPSHWKPEWHKKNKTISHQFYNWTSLDTGGSAELNWDDQLPPFQSRPDTYPSSGWRCPSRSVSNCDIDKEGEIPNKDLWAPYGSPVKYCLAEIVPEQCRLQFSLNIAIAVIVCNFIKASCILLMIWKARAHYLVTIGDAMSSFLDHPDPETGGRCLHSKKLIEQEWNWMAVHGYRDPKNLNVEPERYQPERRRWARAASKTRWGMTYILYFIALICAAVFIKKAMAGQPTNIKALWKTGFGTLNGNNLLETTTSITGGIILANIPQAVLSYLYLCFNALYTCMLVQHEWSSYFRSPKGLRVTSPSGDQRSTYWLQLPYRYALPLTVMSGLLHWLASQSLFMVSVIIIDEARTADENRSITTCGYSPVAIILTTIVGSLIVIGGVLLGFRKYPAGMPLASSCSAAISAACHPPKGDVDAAVSLVGWGVVEEGEGRDGVGHVSFSSRVVSPPVVGKLYA